MINRIILILSVFILIQATANGQVPKPSKPQRVQKTETNKNNKCFLAIFEIQDADDYLDQIKATKDLKEIKRLLELVKSNFEDNELYSVICPCILKQQQVIWLMTDEPQDKIESALKSNDVKIIQNLVEEVSDDVFYILVFYNKCLR